MPVCPSPEGVCQVAGAFSLALHITLGPMVQATDVRFIGWGWHLQAFRAAVLTAAAPSLLKPIQAETAAVTHTGERQDTLLF